MEFIYTAGSHRLDVQSVSIVADGKEIARDEHDDYAGTPSEANIYRFKIMAVS